MKRGFTLIEVMIYIGVLVLAGTVVAAIFRYSQRAQQNSSAAYAVTGQTDTSIHALRQDLQETVLGSVRTFRGTAALGPIVSFISSRQPAEGSGAGFIPNQFLINEYGMPRWRKHVCWGLVRKNATDQVGSVVRWEVPLTGNDLDRLPKALATAPTNAAKPRTMLHHVLGPGRRVTGLGGPVTTYTGDAQWGGFRCQFVRRAGGETGTESFSDVNPALNLSGYTSNTRLVEVEMAVLESVVGSSLTNFYTIKFRVSPRH